MSIVSLAAMQTFYDTTTGNGLRSVSFCPLAVFESTSYQCSAKGTIPNNSAIEELLNDRNEQRFQQKCFPFSYV